MVFKCEEILENITSSIFYLEFNYKKKEIEKIEFLNLRNYTNYSKEDLTLEVIKENMLDDYEKSIQKLMELANGKKRAEIVYRFMSKDDKIVFLKTVVTLIKKDSSKIYCIGVNENVTKEKE